MTLEETTFASETVDVSEKRQFMINADLLDVMKIIVNTVKLESETTSSESILYYTVKHVLKNPKIRPDNTSVAPAIFVYYLELYKEAINREDEVESYNLACLSLFDLFEENYNDTTLRKLLMMSGESLNEIIIQRLSAMKELTVADVLPSLTNVAVVSESIRKFTSFRYRKNNKAYINWIKQFLQRCLSDPKLTFMEEDTSVKQVIDQITKGKKQIVI